MDFKQKYLKYKEKYLGLKRMFGGAEVGDRLLDTTTNESIGTITKVLADGYELNTLIDGVPKKVLKDEVNEGSESSKRYNIMKKKIAAPTPAPAPAPASGSSNSSSGASNSSAAAASSISERKEKCLNCQLEFSINLLKLCGTCRVARYCSVECQKANWGIHKRICNLLKEEREKLGPSEDVSTILARGDIASRIALLKTISENSPADTMVGLSAGRKHQEVMNGPSLPGETQDAKLLRARIAYVTHMRDSGNPINGSPGGEVPLIEACRMGDLVGVKAFVLSGADVNKVGPGGEKPLSVAKKADIRAFLIANGAT